MKSPRISVLMAAWNAERYLSDAVNSVLSQTEPGFELVVVDDGSTDRTPDLLRQFASDDERVRCFRHSKSRGAATARNTGLKRCRAPLVAIFDADDVMMPERLERQLEAFRRHPEVGIIGSFGFLIDSAGTRTGTFSCPVGDSAIRFRMIVGGAFWNTTTAYRTTLLHALGGYDARYEGSEDYDLWARILEVSGGLNLSEPLVAQRIHSESLTARSTIAFESHCRISRRLLERYLDHPVSEAESRALISLFNYGWRFVLTRSDVAQGLSLAKAVHTRGHGNVDNESLEWFVNRVIRSTFLQARVQAPHDRGLSLSLGVRYLQAKPAALVSREFVGLMLAWLTPRSLSSAVARALRREA